MPAKFYSKNIYKQFKHFATWEPGTPLKLGDIGTLDGHLFTPIDNLKNLDIEFEIRTDETAVDIDWFSENAVEFKSKLAGKALEGSAIAEADAGLVINFTKDKALVIKMKGTRTHFISDQIQLAREIERRFNEGEGAEKWEKDWVVITHLLEAESGSVIVSKDSGGSVELKANGEVNLENLDLADLDAGFSIVSKKSIGAITIAQEQILPMFKLGGIRKKFLQREGDFVSRGMESNTETEEVDAFGEIEIEE